MIRLDKYMLECLLYSNYVILNKDLVCIYQYNRYNNIIIIISFDGTAARRQRRSTTDFNIQFSAFGEDFSIKLSRAPAVLHPKAAILFVDGNDTHTWTGPYPDCFLTGDVGSHKGTASVSYCTKLVCILALKNVNGLSRIPSIFSLH